MNHKLLLRHHRFLVAILALLNLLSLTGSGISAAQRNSAPPSRPQTVDPMPTYSITWTATGKGFTDITDTQGRRTVKSRKITITGSGIWRRYASGDYDYFPFNLTITDNYDAVDTVPCFYGGSYSNHDTVSITDPGRYTGGPIRDDPQISTPVQLPDGSWYMYPVIIYYGSHYFSYRHDYDFISCNGSESIYTSTAQLELYQDLMTNGGMHYLAADAQGKVFTTTDQYVVDYLAPPLTVTWNVTVRVLDGRDLTVDRLEVTQALQDGANTLPLVHGRRTVVRAYLGIGQDPTSVPFVTGKLNGYVGATLLGSVTPFNPGGRIVARVDPNWQQIDDTLNFELPYAWTLQPTLRLEVEVNPDHTVAEANYNNNKLSTSMTLLPCGGVSVTYVPIHYTPPGGYSPTDPGTNISTGAGFMRKIYPIPDKGLAYFPHSGMVLTQNINMTGTDALVLDRLTTELLSSSAPRAEHIYAWLPPLAYQHNGLGDQPGAAAFGNDTESPNKWRRTFAHEIGHNYGLHHSVSTTAGRHWFDVYDRVIKPVPASVGGQDLLDVMVPNRLESEAWIDPGYYEYLVGEICSSGAVLAAANTKSPTAVDTLIVSGILSNTTPAAGNLDPLYHFTTVPTYTLPVGPQYCVNLRNAANTLLSQYCFNQDFAVDSGTPAAAMPFGMVVPYPVGLNRVELVQGATVLSSRVASTNTPTVTVTFPNAAGLTLSGSQNITWTGSDLDGNPLTYNLLYSRDNGATWTGIGSGITGSNYNIDFSGLPGTTGASGKIKVMVSDGFRSAEDSSNNSFSVGNKPPSAAVIISPPSGAIFTAGPKVVLEGAGMDLENGSLGDSALSWVSSMDGTLGTGQLQEVTLSPGIHTITLTATDTGGLTNTASIQITIVQPPPIKYVFLPLIRK
jgi:hypothetical protein